MTRFTLQDVLLRMITRPLNGVSGVYYKIRWEQDAGLWALTRARLPRDHDKTTPYRAEEGVGKPEFFLNPQGNLVIESQFWWKPKVGYRIRSKPHTDESFYEGTERYFYEQGRVKRKVDKRQREEERLGAIKFQIASFLQETGRAQAGIEFLPVGVEIDLGAQAEVKDEEIERVLKPLLQPENLIRQSTVCCDSPDGVDAFYCDPVNVRARRPNLTIVNEHHYLRPLALDLKLEVLGECSHLGRPAVLVRGVPRTIEEQDEMLWVDWWGAPDDWWLVCDHYELAIDMESGLLLYYRGVVGSKTMVRSEMLELVFDPPEVLDESIFRGGKATRSAP